MTDARPIGVFDSGVGGLTVLRAIHDLLPRESTIYVGDLAYFPYGPRPLSEVRARARALTGFFQEQDVKALVVACNTATAAAFEDVEGWFGGATVGVVRPGAEEAVAASSQRRIGVLATEGAVRSQAYRTAILDVCPDCEVEQMPLGRLVALVEAGAVDEAETREIINAAVANLIESAGCDTIVLGCTHFPLARAVFDSAVSGRASIIDSAGSTARSLRSLLQAHHLEASSDASPCHRFLATAHADSFVTLAQRLFGEHVEASVVTIELPHVAVPAAS
jgi:glutamate racemase